MKALRWLPVIAGAALAAHHFAPKMSCVCERVFDRLPDTFPPKWMYLNITAIREQNDRILQLLEEQGKTGG
jgi:hypothetical protein